MFQNTPAYKISKAAMNMLVRQYALYLEKEDFIFFILNPGVCISLLQCVNYS